MSIHKYGNYTIDTDALPAVSLQALISRGITHYLGNEQASKVSAFAKKFAEDNNGTELAADEKSAKQAELVEAAHKALLDGTIGTRTGGPKLDPITKATRDIAAAEVAKVLKAGGHKVPKGKETVSIKGEDLTFGDLVDRRIASEKHGARIAKEAKVAVANAGKAVAEESTDDL